MRTSCNICPTLGTTAIWNFPCICPIMSSLSSRSVPARTSKRAVRTERKELDRDVNQSD
jgi:hypothetical protein